MKSFTCLPDSHNAFGSLTNGVLTYFTVDCARYRRVAAYGISGAAEPDVAAAAASSSTFPPASAHPYRGASASSAASTTTVAGPAHQQDVQFTSDTRMHIQRTLILPSAFQGTQCCFSMANRTVFGTDLAFIGAANGLLALAVLQEDLLVYVRGKDPQAIREQLQRGAADAPTSTTTTTTAPATAAAAAGLHRSASVASSATSDGVSSSPWLQASPLPSPIDPIAPHPSPSSASGPLFVSASSPGSMGMPAVASDGSLGAPSTLSAARPAFRRDAPSTITWMRDKPLVLVGYTAGRVEWYQVWISPARQQELLDPAKELPYGAPVTPGAFAYQALNRDANTSRVARVVTGGQRTGLRTELVAACTLPEAGALVSSDHFPFNGAVAVVGEHGVLYLFDTDQPEAPLCEVRLSTASASFLYCHPFLPLVGVLAQSVWADTPPSPPPSQHDVSGGGGVAALHAAATTAAASTAVPPGWGRRRDLSPSRAFGHGRRGVSASAGAAAASPTSNGTARDAVGLPQSDATRQARHVGWRDDTAATVASGHLPAGSGAAHVLGGLASSAGVHTGCVLMVVEYRKDPPPRQLARTWTGAMPPPPSHRLAQVLCHRMEGVAPRYGTYYNFSWKFSFELELVVANLEEGALRVVRAARGPLGGRGALLPAAAVSDRDEALGGAVVVAGGERVVPEVDAAGAGGAGPSDGYRVVQDYTVRLPLHSLVNVEYVSAATSALSSQSALPLSTTTTTGGRADDGGGDGNAAGGSGGELYAFQQEALRYARQTLLLGAAAAAVDPRSRLGFSAGVSLHHVSGGGGGGVLCRPAHPLWAGLAVVSMPQRGGSWDAEGGGAGLASGHGVDGGSHGLRHRHHRSSSGSGSGDVLAAFDALYGAAAGGASAAAAEGGRGATASGGPQLKENALAAAMLQPFRGDTGAVVLGVSSGGGFGHRRRRAGSASNNGSVPGGTEASSSNWLSSSTTTTSVSTQQPSTRQRRRRGGGVAVMSHAARRRRDPSAPAVAVPSYAVKSTQNDIANAVLIAADQRVDLHRMLRIGPGNVSCVVGMNAAGEVASVPIEVRAVAAWHEEGSVFVGLGPTLCAADLVSIQGIERLMRRRHAAGFGLSAVANLAAVTKVGGYGSVDVHMIFAYIATLEAVSLVAPFGPVPSLMELLHRSTAVPTTAHGAAAAAAGGAAAAAPSAEAGGGTGGSTRRDGGAAARPGPAWRAVMDDCVCHDDVRCLLALHVLRWMPTPASDGASPPTSGGGGAFAASPLSQLAAVLPPSAPLTESSPNAEVERAVAVEVTHRRHATAAALLLRFAGRSPSYRAVATLLQRPAEAQAMVRDSDPRVCASFRASLSPWLLVVFHCLCETVEGEAGGAVAAVPPRTALPPSLYRDPALPFWDRVALAIVMEAGGPAPVFHHVMRDLLYPECNPIQALLLHRGIHLRTCAAMQDIVDCTGDFQLGACLFARVGVLTTAAVMAFPFLLDAEVSAAAVAAATAAADSAGVVVPASSAAHSTILGLAGSPELSVFSFGSPVFSDTGLGGGGAGAAAADDGAAGALCEDGTASSSPFSYLRSSRARHGGGGAGDAGVTVAAGSLEEAVAHTARLVRNSALPPPDRVPGGVAAAEVGGPVHAADPPGGVARYAAGGGAALFPGPPFHGPGPGEAEAHDAGDDAEADVPWVWWAAAYRSFLDDEQAFVRRTTFDVECQQLRGRAFLLRDVAVSAASTAASPTRWGNGNGTASSSGGGGGRYGKGAVLPLLRAASAAREADAAGRRRSSPASDDHASLTVARRAATGGGTGGGGNGGASATRGLLTLPPTVGLYAAAGELSRAASTLYGATGASTTTTVADPPRPKRCVCGVPHTGTQLLRSLLSLSGTATTRCSVCLEPVRLGARDVATAFAWCSSCGHGGHAHHLQHWFRTHRRCPVDGCDCHCDEDSSLY